MKQNIEYIFIITIKDLKMNQILGSNNTQSVDMSLNK